MHAHDKEGSTWAINKCGVRIKHPAQERELQSRRTKEKNPVSGRNLAELYCTRSGSFQILVLTSDSSCFCTRREAEEPTPFPAPMHTFRLLQYFSQIASLRLRPIKLRKVQLIKRQNFLSLKFFWGVLRYLYIFISYLNL